MTPYSREIPWVRFERVPNQPFYVECAVCGIAGSGDTAGVHAFAAQHQVHQPVEDYVPLGDAVARVAQPIARAFHMAPCTPCEARRRALNRTVKKSWWPF